jgi:hypothetical protein
MDLREQIHGSFCAASAAASGEAAPHSLTKRIHKRRSSSRASSSRSEPYAAVSALATIVASTVFFVASPALATAADSCPNAQFRTGYSAYLPDCRAYEMVSPLDKNGFDIRELGAQPSLSGDVVTYTSWGAFAGNAAASAPDQYLASRSSQGWATAGIMPPMAPNSSPINFGFQGFSADLSRMVEVNGDPPVDGAVPNSTNLYRRDADESLHLLTPGEPATGVTAPAFAGASSDFSHVIFEQNEALTPGAPPPGLGVLNVYESVNGTLRLVTVLPDGTPSPTGGQASLVVHNVSRNGSRIFWQGNTPSPSFVREDGTTTVKISGTQRTPPDPNGSGGDRTTLWAAATDGSKAFFTSPEMLTNDANTGTSDHGNDLYQYDVADGTLVDLTPDADPGDPNGADVQGVVGLSDDGSRIYFVANGVLAAGATHGDCVGGGTCNLYVRHAGVTRFIASLTAAQDPVDNISDSPDWEHQYDHGHGKDGSWAQVSGDGRHLLFTTRAAQPGFDNNGHREVYLYDASGAGQLTCVSCNSKGVAAGDAVPNQAFPPTIFGSPSGHLLYSSGFVRNLSSDGSRVFFMSQEALVPQDTNSQWDVYEWENGAVHLISSGQSDSPSLFVGSTPSGNDVFFVNRQQLVDQDLDANADLYDARVGGGFPSPPGAPAPCGADDCRGALSGPPGAAPTAATVTFSGPGNATPAPSVRVLHSVVHGATLRLVVRVLVAGRVTVQGHSLGSVTRSLRAAGVYSLRVRLNQAARSTLRHRRRLHISARVAFTAATGEYSSSTVRLTVKA